MREGADVGDVGRGGATGWREPTGDDALARFGETGRNGPPLEVVLIKRPVRGEAVLIGPGADSARASVVVSTRVDADDTEAALWGLLFGLLGTNGEGPL